jgi:hypothetical protein
MIMEIKNMNFMQLVAAEQAANAVRKNYEDKVAMNRCNFNVPQTTQDEVYRELSQKLSMVNAVRIKLLAEMENKLLALKDDNE